MKRTSSLIGAAVCLLALASCDKENVADLQNGMNAAEGTMNLKIVPEELAETRAGGTLQAYTDSQTYESQVNSVQLLVFDSDGKLNIYKNLGDSTGTSINTTQGTKTVWAVVNGPDLSAIQVLDSLKAKALDLSANSITASDGFVMAGSNTCTVGASAVSCSITVSRLAARVALVSVKNSLPASYGTLTVNRVFLSNIVGNQDISGEAAASTWYNKEGRMDETTRASEHVIDGTSYTASLPSLTFKQVSSAIANSGSYSPSTPDLFYCYANASTTAPDGFNDPFSAQRTVLVIDASIGNVRYFYPVVLNKSAIVRNTAYTVAVEVTGLGSDDPNKPVQKGSINATVTVAGWATGSVYEETI